MALTAYCEPGEVRAALSVNDVELPDTVLNLPVYEIGLVRELNKVSVSLPAAFSAASAVAEESRTEAQSALIDATHLFAVYACAKQVGVSLGTLATKEVGDGKAMVARFSDSPYKATMLEVEKYYAVARVNLSEALSTYQGGSAVAAVPPTLLKVSSRGVDPVTGV